MSESRAEKSERTKKTTPRGFYHRQTESFASFREDWGVSALPKNYFNCCLAAVKMAKISNRFEWTVKSDRYMLSGGWVVIPERRTQHLLFSLSTRLDPLSNYMLELLFILFPSIFFTFSHTRPTTTLSHFSIENSKFDFVHSLIHFARHVHLLMPRRTFIEYCRWKWVCAGSAITLMWIPEPF